MHEKLTTAQNNLSDFVKISPNTNGAVFPAKYNVLTLSQSTAHFKLYTNQSQSQWRFLGFSERGLSLKLSVLRWLKTDSSTFRDLDFDVSL